MQHPENNFEESYDVFLNHEDMLDMFKLLACCTKVNKMEVLYLLVKCNFSLNTILTTLLRQTVKKVTYKYRTVTYT